LSTLRKSISLLLFLMLLFIPSLACGLLENPTDEEITGEKIRNQEILMTQQAALENTDQLRFTFTGEKEQIYHQDFVNNTIFYVDNTTGIVIASNSAPFELPFGCQTARGTDTVKFNGTIKGNMISGDMTIQTVFTATGCDTSASTVDFEITGKLNAELENGTWVGTLTGTVTHTQTWEDHLGPEVDETHPVSFAAIGVSVK